ncbi:MAG: hypothetical protein QOE60_2370 [Thermoleophilaceae bacterium]|nr:hypothetical protein [Thermoleophilaceae bacterium]
MRLRRTAFALLATGTALAATGGALASPQFSATFDLTYLSRQPGAPSGQIPSITWSDPGAPAEVPKVIKRIELTFHRGTQFDTSALARCRASDDKIKSKGASACPDASQLGRGHTTGASSSGDEFVTDVTLFNGRGEIIVLVTVGGTPITEFRDHVSGRRITIEPALPAGVSLKRLKLRIGPHSTGHGARQRTYMRNPPSCPKSGKWTTVAKLTYANGSTQTLRSGSPCKRKD